MSVRATIIEMLDRESFQPFRVLTSGGESFVIHDPHSVAVSQSQAFIAHPRSDPISYVQLLHVAAIDTATNGHARRKRR